MLSGIHIMYSYSTTAVLSKTVSTTKYTCIYINYIYIYIYMHVHVPIINYDGPLTFTAGQRPLDMKERQSVNSFGGLWSGDLFRSKAVPRSLYLDVLIGNERIIWLFISIAALCASLSKEKLT